MAAFGARILRRYSPCRGTENFVDGSARARARARALALSPVRARVSAAPARDSRVRNGLFPGQI